MTIGQTTIQLSKIIDHAVRRIGLPAEAQTPEIINTAKDNLFLLLTSLVNKGINYWCLDEQFVTLVENQVKYTLPDGTVDIFDTNYRTVTDTSGTDTSYATSFVREFTEATETRLIRLDSSTSGTITLSYSTDGVSYTTHSTITHDGTDKWYGIDPTIDDVFLKLSVSTGTLSVTSLTTCSAYNDVPLYRMNRTQYMNLTDKYTPGTPYQFWVDRQLTPVIWIWQVPNSTAAGNCIQFIRHHQISDIGSLTETIDIPIRWHEAVIWQLAKNLALELPNTPPERVKICLEAADKSTFEAELEERDNSPISFAPDIGVYT